VFTHKAVALNEALSEGCEMQLTVSRWFQIFQQSHRLIQKASISLIGHIKKFSTLSGQKETQNTPFSCHFIPISFLCLHCIMFHQLSMIVRFYIETVPETVTICTIYTILKSMFLMLFFFLISTGAKAKESNFQKCSRLN